MIDRTTAALLQRDLDRVLTEGLERASGHGADYLELWRALGRATLDGKRFRPALMMAAYRAYDGRQDEVAGRVAGALELLHTALVIHDDVIDGDLVRRGKSNVVGTFAQRARDRLVSPQGCATFGLAAGVLAGDLALVGATREIALCGADPLTTRRLLDLLDHAVHVSAAGELADVALSLTGSGGLGTVVEVIAMEESKTAVYSFQLPLQAGALLAGAPERTVELLGEVGRLAGVGFQLLDDLLGVFGDESVTGKSALGDLREGKLTPLIAHARSTSSWPELSRHVGDRTIDEDRAETVRALLTACGSRMYVEQLARSYLTRSLAAAVDLGAAPCLMQELSGLSERVLGDAA